MAGVNTEKYTYQTRHFLFKFIAGKRIGEQRTPLDNQPHTKLAKGIYVRVRQKLTEGRQQLWR